MKHPLFLIIAVLALVGMMLVPASVTAQQAPVIAQEGAPKDAVKATATGTLNVAGPWKWLIVPKNPGAEPDATFNVLLEQDGEVVKGKFDCDGCARTVKNAPVSGTLKNGRLELTRKDLAFTGFDLTVMSENELNGTYTGRLGRRYDVKGTRPQ